jgi:hypothetical protein
MSRIRTLKPEFWTDEKMAPLDDTARLVFLALISMADDGGRLVNSPKAIEAFIWPFHADRSRELRDALATLSRMGRIRSGKTEAGQSVVEIVHWDRHQKIDKPNANKMLPAIVAEVPPPPIVTSPRGNVAPDSREIREDVAKESRLNPDPDPDPDPLPAIAGQPKNWVTRAAEIYLDTTGAPMLDCGRWGKQTNQLKAKHGGDRVLRVWQFACEQLPGDWGRGVLKWAWPEHYPEFEAGLDHGVTDPTYERFAGRLTRKGAA